MEIENFSYVEVTTEMVLKIQPKGPPHAVVVVVLTLSSIIAVYLTLTSTWYHYCFSSEKLRLTNRLCLLCVYLQFCGCIWVWIFISTNVFFNVCVLNTFVIIFFAVGTQGFVYGILWMRQQSFANRPAFNFLNGLKGKILSYVILLGIILDPIAQIILNGSIRLIFNAPCDIPLSDDNKNSIAIPMALLYLFNVTFQVSLVAMILFPIVKHIRKSGIKSAGKLDDVIKRLSISALICVVTDVIFFVQAVAIPIQDLTAPASSLSVGINLVALMYSFADFRIRLFPFIKPKVTENEQINGELSTKIEHLN